MDDGLAGAIQTLARLTGTARGGGLTHKAALASLTTARRLAAELERGELALIEAARGGGATWYQIAAAMGASRRQTAQKRHADLSRRHRRPPVVDMRQPLEAGPAAASAPDGVSVQAGGAASDDTVPAPASDAARRRRRPAQGLAAGTGRGRQRGPRISPETIGEGRYELVRAPDHAESRAWHVLVDGQRAGLVRPTWRGERGCPGWQPVTNAGTALPVTGTSRVTPAGNARTRDAAAISLLHALQRQQEHQHRHKGTA
jgi:hypothetical protein